MSQPRSAEHRTILVVDVEGFSDQRRANPHRLVVREGLYRALLEAFETTGLGWSDCHHEDCGDGVFVLIPPNVPKALLVDSLPGALADALRRHNEAHSGHERIRLRMAVHAGEVTFDDHGATGASVNLTFRLVDAAGLKAALAASPGLLAVIVSTWFFDEVVRHSTSTDPETFRSCQVEVKETHTTAWISLPDHPYPPAPVVPPVGRVNASVTSGVMIQRWQRSAYVNHDQLFGADRLIELVADTVANIQVDRVTSVLGDGGIGKTAIAYEAVRSVAQTGCFSRIAWASAANPLKDTDWAGDGRAVSAQWLDILKEIGDQLDFDLGLSRALWGTEFGRRIAELDAADRVLVIVDNLETLPDATDAIRQLRGMGVVRPHALLVTTRWELQPHLSPIAEFRVRSLGQPDALRLVRHLGVGDPDLSLADDQVLAPVLAVTEGNPFLIKLAIQHYLSSHRPLDRVMHDLRQLREDYDDTPSLARRVRSHLYTASLQELERRCGEQRADAFLATFCVKGRGDAFGYEELADVSGIDTLDDFDAVLTAACQLSLVTSFGDLSAGVLDRRYTIHSLLYDFTCGMP